MNEWYCASSRGNICTHTRTRTHHLSKYRPGLRSQIESSSVHRVELTRAEISDFSKYNWLSKFPLSVHARGAENIVMNYSRTLSLTVQLGLYEIKACNQVALEAFWRFLKLDAQIRISTEFNVCKHCSNADAELCTKGVRCLLQVYPMMWVKHRPHANPYLTLADPLSRISGRILQRKNLFNDKKRRWGR